MAIKLRLKKIGKKHQPYYRIVAIDSRAKRGGREKEILGAYNPRGEGERGEVTLDRDRVKYWLDCGAQVSETVGSILKEEGLLPERLAR